MPTTYTKSLREPATTPGSPPEVQSRTTIVDDYGTLIEVDPSPARWGTAQLTLVCNTCRSAHSFALNEVPSACPRCVRLNALALALPGDARVQLP